MTANAISNAVAILKFRADELRHLSVDYHEGALSDDLMRIESAIRGVAASLCLVALDATPRAIPNASRPIGPPNRKIKEGEQPSSARIKP